MTRKAGAAGRFHGGEVVALPGVEMRLSAEQAIRAAIDTQIFSALRMLEPLDGGRAVQAVYVALIRRLPNVLPDRKRIAIDCGFSESSVKRAIGLLESCGLMEVERIKGRSSIYHLADVRSGDIASECLSKIRKVSRGSCAKGQEVSRFISGPTRNPGRVTCEPSGRAKSEPGVGSEVVQKETSKNQFKQQAAAEVENDGKDSLEMVLRRWGLTSASYLVTPGHERAIAILTENRARAAKLIDRTMRQGNWTDAAGVGARVAFLRENVGRVAARLDLDARDACVKGKEVARRAARIAENLIRPNAVELDLLTDERFSMLLRRGLERLDEEEAVLRILAESEPVRQSIVAGELEREEFEEEVRRMPAEEFRNCCERLFLVQPGLKRLYAGVGREGRGLMVCLLEFLWKERTGAAEPYAAGTETSELYRHELIKVSSLFQGHIRVGSEEDMVQERNG